MSNFESLTLDWFDENVEQTRLFWRLILDGHNGEIKLSKELALWANIGTADDHRFIRLICHRFPYLEENQPENPHVPIAGRYTAEEVTPANRVDASDSLGLKFNQSWIEVEDFGLCHQLDQLLTLAGLEPICDADSAELSTLSSAVVASLVRQFACGKKLYELLDGTRDDRVKCVRSGRYIGENVSVVVDGRFEQSDEAPVLYLPEVMASGEEGFVTSPIYLAQRGEPQGTRRIHWRCPNIHNPAPDSEPFGIWPPTNLARYIMTVRQGFDLDSGVHAFNLLADSVPVTSPHEADPQVTFTIDPFNWYIGLKPGAEKIPFTGVIHRLVFDPNASCTGCVT